MTFWVWRCTKCDNFNNSLKSLLPLDKVSLKCRRCNKSHKLRKRGVYGLNVKLYEVDSSDKAIALVKKFQELKENI